MVFDFKNILVGMIIGFILAFFLFFLLNDVHIDIRIGDNVNKKGIVDSY
jgi:hypothetical protein